MNDTDKVNILLVDDQPGKLLTYEAILQDLKENLVKATSAREALDFLLRNEVAVVLVDVVMPELDGFELASMIRQHPRFRKTAIILVSAVLMTDVDRLRGYGSGAMDYVPVPVVPEILRAKVAIFIDLYRKTRQLERVNEELEERVAQRTAELEASNARLRESEERLRLATEAGQCGTWDWNVASGALLLSEETLRMSGRTADGLTGQLRDFDAILHAEDRDRVYEHFGRLMRDRAEEFSDEYRLQRPDGGVVWVAARGRFTYGPEGEPLRMVGVCLDITDRREAELERRAHRERLAQLVEERTAELERSHERLRFSERMASIGTLAAGIGHDLGNLLLPVRLRLESLEARALPDEVRDDVAAIKQATEYVQRLTSGLRTLAQDPSVHPGGADRIELHEWWREAEPLLKSALPRGVLLTAALPAEPTEIAIGRPAFAQAVLNLVQNAGDAMRERGRGKIHVEAKLAADGLVHICVHDDGPGMTEEVRRRCMDPFFTTRTRGLSTGLGLALVQSVIQQAGGTMLVDSELGRGSVFTLCLRAAPRRELPREAEHRSPVAVVSVKDVRTRAVLSAILRSLKYDVSTNEPPDLEDTQLWITESDGEGVGAPKVFVDGKPGRRAVVFAPHPLGIADGRIVEMVGPPKPGDVRDMLSRLAAESQAAV